MLAKRLTSRISYFSYNLHSSLAINLKHKLFPISILNKLYCSIRPKDFINCWSCRKDISHETFFCKYCLNIQEPSTMFQEKNYFDLFNLSTNYEMNKKQLDLEYKKLQMRFHPDKLENKSNQGIKYSEKYSSHINIAYHTLKNDYYRALYLLKLNNIVLNDERRMEDMDFLEEIMLKRAAVENCNNKEKILKMQKQNQNLIDEINKEMTELFKQRKYEDAIPLLEKLKYYIAIDEAIEKWIESYLHHTHSQF